MSTNSKAKEVRSDYTIATSDLTPPLILEREGHPIAVLISIQEYEQYQTLLKEYQYISANEARQAADQVVFGDLVGCALSSADPEWCAEPSPHWRVPYRHLDGTLLAMVNVDARTRAVAFTEQQREELLNQIERRTAP